MRGSVITIRVIAVHSHLRFVVTSGAVAGLQDYLIVVTVAGVAGARLLAVARIFWLSTRNNHQLSQITISNFMTTFETGFSKAKECAVVEALWIPFLD